MTATEMRTAARPLNPRIQLRDIWFLMRQFQERNLARCINPRQTNGRLYCLTDYGRQVVEDGFGITVGISGKGINWKKYSWVVRARIRKLTLLGIGKRTDQNGTAVAAAEIRKALREAHPVGLNPVIRAVKELRSLGLIAVVGLKNGTRNTYRLTTSGRRIVAQLLV